MSLAVCHVSLGNSTHFASVWQQEASAGKASPLHRPWQDDDTPASSFVTQGLDWICTFEWYIGYVMDGMCVPVPLHGHI
jgi:hypothetical protein